MENSITSSPHESIRLIGRPIQLVHDKMINGIRDRVYDINLVEEILCDPMIQAKHISIISIIGPIRKGKSFLMNFLLKYILSKYNATWLSHLDQPLDGFSWSTGLHSDTSGLVMWSEPFLTKVDDEERVIILVDVQGTFNKFSSIDDCTNLASFSLLISSLLLINIPDAFDDEMVDFCELFINHADLIIGSWGFVKQSHSITAIIRDWNYPNEFAFGLTGGELYLKHLIKMNMAISTKNQDNVFLKQYYKNIFSYFRCCLLPHPGMKVTTSQHFDGRIRDINHAFIEQLKILVLHIVCPDNLQRKKINDHFLTCKEYFQYLKSVSAILKNESFLQIRNIMTENGYLNQSEFLQQVQGFYIASMDKVMTVNGEFIQTRKLDEEHKFLLSAIHTKLRQSKMFNKAFMLENTKLLINSRLNAILEKYKTDNTNKNLQMSIFTPFSLIILLVFSYFMFFFITPFQIKYISFSIEIIFYGILGINLLWISTCYWEMDLISAILDELTDILIFYIYQPIIDHLKNKPVKVLDPFYQTFFEKNINYDETSNDT